MEKAEERWWDRLLTSEDSIDLKTINAERDFATLPEEDQQRIQELVWNKRQQELGKPTSDQTVSNWLSKTKNFNFNYILGTEEEKQTPG